MASQGNNKVALITGSTSGIGLATAKALAKEGCNIIISGFASAEEIDTIKKDITSESGVKVDYVGCDLRKVSEIGDMVKDIFKLYSDGIDILVNNAGFNHVCNIEEFPDDAWNDMVAIMFTAAFHLIKSFIPAMKKKGWGRIVNMSSQLGAVAIRGKTPYTAIKTGLIGLSKGVALETAEYGITCNAVCPTFAMTPLIEEQIKNNMVKNGKTYEEETAFFADQIPVKKILTPEQIADYIKYLCFSEASPMMTGSAYLLDGGFTAQ